jgi:hypothetical protein
MINKIGPDFSLLPTGSGKDTLQPSSLRGATHIWDFSQTTITNGVGTTPDLIGNNDIVFTGYHSSYTYMTEKGLGLLARVATDTGVILDNEYTIAFIIGLHPTNGIYEKGSLFNGQVFDGSNYSNSVKRSSSGWDSLINGVSSGSVLSDNTQLVIASYNNNTGESVLVSEYDALFSVNNKGPLGIFSAGNVNLHFGAVGSNDSNDFAGLAVWACYIPKYYGTHRELSIIRKYLQNVISAKGLAI